MNKMKLGIIFGGQSGEHEVSLMSSTSIINVIDREIYDLTLIGITKTGKWLLYNGEIDKIKTGEWEDEGINIFLSLDPDYKGLFTINNCHREFYQLDIVFPVLHGPKGEDGTIQGLFEVLQIPYVSSDVMSSALGMDKAFSKKLFEYAGLPILRYQVYSKNQFAAEKENTVKNIEEELGYPCFVKPCNLGSSVGISKAHNRSELYEAIKTAFLYDNRIIIEEFVNAREIELSILGNETPEVSVPGEIVYAKEFYDYEAKYFDNKGTKLIIPAPIPEPVVERIQEVAIKAYKTLNCSIFARADFFYDEVNDKIYINELNTIPGFTHGSMYPKLWEAAGISYTKLVNRLLELAIERHSNK
ncbi:MAG TPA: D-alanine--D-alanine ligase [Thermoanaerobacterales bacterium]|nr:D-alanine--D-alanine ligase [Thermoanaerobacterales bacterium]